MTSEVGSDTEFTDAARIIDELVTALETIAERTTDDGARAIAQEALAAFHGR